MELGYGGLLRPTKNAYGPGDFYLIGTLLSKVSAHERQHPEVHQEKYRKPISYLHANEEGSTDEADVAVVQWARGGTTGPLPVAQGT